MIELKGVKKYYNIGLDNELHVLKGIDLAIKGGEFVAIIGPSGSGKTTLLDVIGCLLKPTAGSIAIEGVNTSELDDNQLARLRRKKLGFVFQEYNLIRVFTALENISLALRIGGKSRQESVSRAKELLRMVGLEQRINHRAGLLSGGEQQRVAIARALANEPKIILADEPTGNLDTKTGKNILELMEWLNLEKGYTFVVVTHDPEVTRYSHRVIYLRDGVIIKEIIKKDKEIVRLDGVIK